MNDEIRQDENPEIQQNADASESGQPVQEQTGVERSGGKKDIIAK